MYDEYKPACPTCGWIQPDDVYYQIIDGEFVSLNVEFINMLGYPLEYPFKVDLKKEYYPITFKVDTCFYEIHFCPNCNCQYKYKVPSFID